MGMDRVEQRRRSNVACLPVVLAVLGVAGCEPGQAQAESPSPEATLPFAARFDVDGVYQLDGASRFAHRGRPIRTALKADEFDDVRAVAPELHAITRSGHPSTSRSPTHRPRGTAPVAYVRRGATPPRPSPR